MTTLVQTAFVMLLLLAAWRDMLTRTLPDSVACAIAAIGLAIRIPLGPAPLLASLTMAAVLFIALLALAMRGWLGGGDVKLAAALAIGLAPGATLDFLVLTVTAGGLLGLGYMAGPHLLRGPLPALGGGFLRRITVVEARRLRRGGPLPYAVAIAAGGILTHLAGP